MIDEQRGQALPLGLVMSVMGKGVRRVKLTAERGGERAALRVGPCAQDRLLIFDLGYFRYQRFDRIDRDGGYFLTRLSGSANPRIVAVHRRLPLLPDQHRPRHA